MRAPSARAFGILLVDSDGAAARSLAGRLTAKGYRVTHAASGRQALAAVRSGSIGVAIVDVALKDMAGHVLALHLKRLRPEVPIIMTSADYDPRLEIQSRQVGILHYAHKPINSHRTIEAVVGKALGRPGRGREASG